MKKTLLVLALVFITTLSFGQIGKIIMSADPNPPSSRWKACDGALYHTNTNTTLFNRIRYTYGGDSLQGVYALPDLRGRTPIGAGHGPGLPPYYGGDKSTYSIQPYSGPHHDYFSYLTIYYYIRVR